MKKNVTIVMDEETARWVLHEYYVTVTAKLDPGLSMDEAQEDVLALEAWKPLPSTVSLTEDAWEIQSRWGFSFWDAMVIAAARAQRCGLLLTEGLSHDQDLDGLRVVSPFLEGPGAF